MPENRTRALKLLTYTIPDLIASGILSPRVRFLVFSDPSNPSQRADLTITSTRNRDYHVEFPRRKNNGSSGPITKQTSTANSRRARSLSFLAIEEEKPYACEPCVFGSCHSSANVVVATPLADDPESSWIHLKHCALQSVPGSQDVMLHTLDNDSVCVERIDVMSAPGRDEIASQAQPLRDDVLGSTWRLSLTDSLVFIIHILARPMGLLCVTNALSHRSDPHSRHPNIRSFSRSKDLQTTEPVSASKCFPNPTKGNKSSITRLIPESEIRAKTSDAPKDSPMRTFYDPDRRNPQDRPHIMALSIKCAPS